MPKAIKRTFWRVSKARNKSSPISHLDLTLSHPLSLQILMFYVLGIFIIGLLVPANSDRLLTANGNDASASPFVIAIENAGIKALPSIINAVILIAAWSSGNSGAPRNLFLSASLRAGLKFPSPTCFPVSFSDLYAASRTLYSLALDRKAPSIFR